MRDARTLKERVRAWLCGDHDAPVVAPSFDVCRLSAGDALVLKLEGFPEKARDEAIKSLSEFAAERGCFVVAIGGSVEYEIRRSVGGTP